MNCKQHLLLGKGWSLSTVSIHDAARESLRLAPARTHRGLRWRGTTAFSRKRANAHTCGQQPPDLRVAAMPPKTAMGELPPPCVKLKNALTELGVDVSVEGLRGCEGALVRNAFDSDHRQLNNR